MASFVKFENFSEDLSNGVHDFTTDTLKVMLTNSAPVAATDEVFADLTEIAAGNGYTAGGDDTQNTVSRTAGVTSIVGVDVVFTGQGGSIASFRYVVLYNDTPTSPANPLIGYWDYGSSISPGDTETFTVDFGSSMFTVT